MGTLPFFSSQGTPLTFSTTDTTNTQGLVAPVSQGGFEQTKLAYNNSQSLNPNIAAMQVTASNPLHKFQTYNCLFTLASLSKNSQKSGKFTAASVENIIASSKGDWGENNKRVPTEFGSYDFFIDDVNILNLASFITQTGNAFATKISFRVTEPYSMGLFLLTMQRAAQAAGFQYSHLEAPYILMIQFAGYINGQPVGTEDTEELTRYIPIKFTKCQWKVTGSGTVYDIEAVPYNEIAFRDQYAKATTDGGLEGATVAEVLLTGHNSLQEKLYYEFQKQVEAKNLESCDLIQIEFPESFAEDSGLGGNVISRSPIFTDLSDSGIMKPPNKDEVYDPINHVYNTTKVTVTNGKNWNFKQGLKVQDVIEEVVIRSTYIAQQFAHGRIQADERGMMNWFRIETRIEDGEDNPALGRQVRTITYRVVPYQIHINRFVPPNTKPAGYTQLASSVYRKYDYIYTGKNTDIVDVNFDFKAGFFVTLPSDATDNTGQNKRNVGGVTGGHEDPDYGFATAANPIPRGFENMIPSYIQADIDAATGSSASNSPITIQTRMLQNLLTAPGDLINLDLTILGDPYFLVSSGMGNQIKRPVGHNLTEDGAVNYQGSEVDIIINFRTPVDLDPATGKYKFLKTIDQWTGLYQVLSIESKFNGNKFTQVLKCIRRRAQLEGSEVTTTYIAPR